MNEPIIWITALGVIVFGLAYWFGPKEQLIEVDPELPRWHWKSKWHWRPLSFYKYGWVLFVAAILGSLMGGDLPEYPVFIGGAAFTIIGYFKLKGY